MRTVKVALAGYGKGGQIYNAPVISSIEGLEIVKIMTSGNKSKANKDYPEAEVVEEFSGITGDSNIDLVVITTPNHLHKQFAEKALIAGKNVIVEKPFTPTVQEAEELISLAKERNKIVTVHHNRRWDSDFLTIQRLLKEGRLGKVVEFEAHFDRFRNYVKDSWKEEKDIPGSGILYDLGSHLIDQALVLFGNPTELFTDLRAQRENSEVVDNFEILLFYPNLKVTLKAGMLVKEKGARYSIYGQNGTFVKHGMDVQEEALQNGKKPKDDPNWGKEPERIWGRINTLNENTTVKSEPGNYTQLYRNVYNTILGKEELLVKPEEARDVIKIIELAQKSNAEKRVVSFK